MTNSRDLFAAVRAPRAVSEGAFALNAGELRDAAPCRAGFADGRHSLARPSKAARDCWRSRAPLSAHADRLRGLAATLPPCQRRAAPLRRDGSALTFFLLFHSKKRKEVARWQVTDLRPCSRPGAAPLPGTRSIRGPTTPPRGHGAEERNRRLRAGGRVALSFERALGLRRPNLCQASARAHDMESSPNLCGREFVEPPHSCRSREKIRLSIFHDGPKTSESRELPHKCDAAGNFQCAARGRATCTFPMEQAPFLVRGSRRSCAATVRGKRRRVAK